VKRGIVPEPDATNVAPSSDVDELVTRVKERGYVTTGAAQRRLREAYFVAIVTPATKQLKKMLADMKH